MTAKDLYHDAVCNALQHDGWIITHDPLVIEIDEIRYEIDLGAETLVAAEKAGRKIAIEVKSFLAPSLSYV
jgi:hypothetical protein